jgi:hypothetical protein
VSSGLTCSVKRLVDGAIARVSLLRGTSNLLAIEAGRPGDNLISEIEVTDDQSREIVLAFEKTYARCLQVPKTKKEGVIVFDGWVLSVDDERPPDQRTCVWGGRDTELTLVLHEEPAFQPCRTLIELAEERWGVDLRAIETEEYFWRKAD